MKVVVDATMLDGGPSGAATRLAALAAEHAARGAVEVLHLVRPGADPLPRARCLAFPGMHTPWGRARAGPALERLLAEEGAAAFQAGALPLPHVRSPPVALTLHDLRFLESGGAQGPLRRLWGRTFLRRNLSHAAAVVAVSETTAAALRRRGLADGQRLHVVPNANTPGLERVRDQGALAAFRERAGLGRYVLAVGPLAGHKRVGFLLDVLAALRRSAEGRDLELALVGRRDPAAARVWARRGARRGLGSALALLGPLGEEDLALAFSSAAALVVAGRVEGFSIPVVDAQRLGLPVAAVAAGALPEVCGDAAWMAEPDDVLGFAAAVLGAVTPGDLREARLAAGFSRAARWSWSASARHLEDLWARLASQSAGGEGGETGGESGERGTP